MYRTQSSLNLLTVNLTLILSLLLCSLPMKTLAQSRSIPPVQGRPRGTLPGGPRFQSPSRNQPTPPAPPASIDAPGARESVPVQLRSTCLTSEKPLTPLMPQGSGLTVAAYPEFFFYIPETSATKAEFVLVDSKGEEVYKFSFRITGEPGIISLSIPKFATIPPLEIGKNYRWSLSVICNPQDRLEDASVMGSIQRVEPNPTLRAELKQVTPRAQVFLYAENGIWYDALATLAALRRAYPNDWTVTSDWTTLLESVGLKEFSEEPLVGNSNE
ncbi:MAG TPA: hypothetical protein DD379_02000 [Cyanobacteria bacterium UBA11162]|nr:hypothetical protein [Cyanobacteria bacterium UBA11162]